MNRVKYLGLPLWVWLIIIGMIAYNCYISTSIIIQDNNVKTKKESIKIVKTLKKEEFANNENTKIYNFNTTWCGYSTQFQPEWDNFAKNKIDNVTMIDAKCDDKSSPYAKLATKYGVNGFPTVVAEKNGKIKHYNGKRTEKDLLSWTNSGCGF